MRKLLVFLFIASAAFAAEPPLPNGTPAATIDLATAEGVNLVNGAWRYSDTRIIETDFVLAGDDGQPGAAKSRAYDFTPHAGGSEFDDSQWQTISAASLNKRRTAGRLAFNWYRLRVTVPERIGAFDPSGSTVVLDISLDDYAEVWVNGALPRRAAQSGGSVIGGWNAPNRLVIARGAKPGQQIQLAVFGINGPISDPPTNYVWVRHARLEFFPEAGAPFATAPHELNLRVERLDPAIDAIVPANPKLYKLAEGFTFTEGPVWIPSERALLFSEPNANRIWKYAGGELSLFRDRSGYAGADIAEYRQPGSNGLTLDAAGRLVIDQHGNRRIVRLESDGSESVVVDRYKGKRLNSPNDLVYRSDGALFFTDPPFGLPKFQDDPRRELPFTGVFSLRNGKVNLITRELTGPNGLAFSPDEKHLYVGNWDDHKKVVMRYEIRPDGTAANESLFFDMTGAPGEDAIDGVKVDRDGNVYVSGPGGLWILSPEGKHLGTIITPVHPHNLAWGDDDGRTLYLTARNELYRIRLNVPGAGAHVPR